MAEPSPPPSGGAPGSPAWGALPAGALLEQAFDHAPAGMAIFEPGPGFRCLRHNPLFLSLVDPAGQLGVLLGRPLEELFDQPSARRIGERLGAEGPAFPGDDFAAILTPGLRPRLVRLRVSPLRDAQGGLSALLLAVSEAPAPSIWEPEGPERSARSSEIRYAAIWASTNDAMALSDPEGIVLEANAAYLALYGYSYDQVVGKPFAVIFPLELQEWAMREYHQAFWTAPPEARFESTVVRRDGTQRVVESRVTFLEVNGRRVAMLSTIRDISERKAMEQALAESERRFRTLVELAPVGIWEGDHDGLVTFVNRAYTQISGLSFEQALGDAWMQAIHPDDLERVREAWGRARTMGAPYALDIRYRHPDGGVRWTAAQSRELTDAEGRVSGSIGTVLDITERKGAEEALIRGEARLQASLAEKEVLLKEVHHRVKNNLQVIISLLRLQTQQLVDPQAREQFRDTQNRVRAMALVHEQLYGAEDLAHINFEGYVQSLAASVLRSYLPQHAEVGLVCDIDRELVLAIDTAAPLGLILTELLSNSIKYAFPAERPGTITIRARADHEHLTLTFGDDGVGPAAGVDLSSPASLGLHLVRRLVVQLGGELRSDRSPGLTFQLTIPLALKEDL